VKPAYPALVPIHDRIREGPSWFFTTIQAGHDCMVTTPNAPNPHPPPTHTAMNIRSLLMTLLPWMMLTQQTMSQSSTPFLPADFAVPAVLETGEFRLRMLTVHDVVKDFDAVMTSADHLKGVFGPSATWPEGLTLEQNLIDLGWHQKEFQRRTSFAYTVVAPDEAQVVGCVYVNPTRKVGYDAVVYLWARQSVLESGLEDRLHAAVKAWLAADWPFTRVAFPGREIPWDTWREIPSTP
jgi:hypothetical protein